MIKVWALQNLIGRSNLKHIPLIGSRPGRLLGVLCLDDLNLGLDLAIAHTCRHVLPHESLSASRALTQSSQVGVLEMLNQVNHLTCMMVQNGQMKILGAHKAPESRPEHKPNSAYPH